MEVLVPALVLRVEHVLAVLAPEVGGHRALIGGKRTGGAERLAEPLDPDVARALVGFDKGHVEPVGRELRARNLGIVIDERPVDQGREIGAGRNAGAQSASGKSCDHHEEQRSFHDRIPSGVEGKAARAMTRRMEPHRAKAVERFATKRRGANCEIGATPESWRVAHGELRAPHFARPARCDRVAGAPAGADAFAHKGPLDSKGRMLNYQHG